MRVLGPDWRCIEYCFDTYNRELPPTADKRGMRRNTIRSGLEIPYAVKLETTYLQ